MFKDFVRRHLSTFVMIGATIAITVVMAGGDLTQIAEAGRRGR